MKKPTVLFVTEKWADCNPGGSPSNSHHNLFGSLECADLANYTNFFFEDHAPHIDDALITHHRRLKPDVTVVTMLPGYAHNPTARAFHAISKGSPIVFIWFDVVHRHIWDMAVSVNDFASLCVILDNPYFIPRDKYITLWTPQDTRIYNDPGHKRDLDVTFMGSINNYSDRSQYLNHLACHCGAVIRQAGGQREHNLPPADYAGHIQRSKISLSFSRTRNGLQQTKGRPFEIALCGAMLMEDCNLGTSMWFEPYKDYVPFTSPEDLVDKVNYYLSNPDKMSEITGQGKNKATNHYSPANWWRIVLGKVGLV
jgi:hypothetical protein